MSAQNLRQFGASGRAIGAVTVRSVAVDDEERVGGVRGQILLVDLSMRQTDGTRHVPLLERLWRTHVEQNEALRVAERGMDIPAVGLVGQQALEVCARGGGIGGG